MAWGSASNEQARAEDECTRTIQSETCGACGAARGNSSEEEDEMSHDTEAAVAEQGTSAETDVAGKDVDLEGPTKAKAGPESDVTKNGQRRDGDAMAGLAEIPDGMWRLERDDGGETRTVIPGASAEVYRGQPVHAVYESDGQVKPMAEKTEVSSEQLSVGESTWTSPKKYDASMRAEVTSEGKEKEPVTVGARMVLTQSNPASETGQKEGDGSSDADGPEASRHGEKAGQAEEDKKGDSPSVASGPEPERATDDSASDRGNASEGQAQAEGTRRSDDAILRATLKQPEFVFESGQAAEGVVQIFEDACRDAIDKMKEAATDALGLLRNNLQDNDEFSDDGTAADAFIEFVMTDVWKLAVKQSDKMMPGVGTGVDKAWAVIQWTASDPKKKHSGSAADDANDFHYQVISALNASYSSSLDTMRTASRALKRSLKQLPGVLEDGGDAGPGFATGPMGATLKSISNLTEEVRAAGRQKGLDFYLKKFSELWINSQHEQPDFVGGKFGREIMSAGVVLATGDYKRTSHKIANRSIGIRCPGGRGVAETIKNIDGIEPFDLDCRKRIVVSFSDKLGMLPDAFDNRMSIELDEDSKVRSVSFRRTGTKHWLDVRSRAREIALSFRGMGGELTQL